jgi:transcriptional regulator with GAF, ATPase, and Fis domain
MGLTNSFLPNSEQAEFGLAPQTPSMSTLPRMQMERLPLRTPHRRLGMLSIASKRPYGDSKVNRDSSRSTAKEQDGNDRQKILRVLRETKGRVGGANGAAVRMAINRTTLISRMKKLGIDPKQFS